MQGGHARDVEAAEVQAHLPLRHALRADADAPLGLRRVLGLRRRAHGPLQRLLPPPALRLPRRRRRAHADPPVHHLRLRVHAALLRLGEARRRARDQERPQAGAGAPPHRRAHLVPRHCLPLLRAHQLHRRLPARQLHRLHHPGARAHGDLRAGGGQGERRRAPAARVRRVAGDVRPQLLRGGVGARRRLRLRRVGQHRQFRPAGQHIRAVHQVLPVPAKTLMHRSVNHIN
jgi:hypothetical protein